MWEDNTNCQARLLRRSLFLSLWAYVSIKDKSLSRTVTIFPGSKHRAGAESGKGGVVHVTELVNRFTTLIHALHYHQYTGTVEGGDELGTPPRHV